MQSSLAILSSSQTLQFSWKPHLPRTFSFQNPNISFTAFSLSCSIKTSPDSDSQQPLVLPVVIKRNGRVYRYFWDCNFSLKLVCVDGEDPTTFGHGGLRRLMRICVSGVRDFFIPKHVTENYIEYVKWKLLHRVFSSALQVLATQAMFRAIGVGYAQSLPSAAALNWVLKDGLGRLSRCIYTACVGSAFDTNLKRVRFTTSLMFSLSIGVELLTPAFPHCFLLLASVANIAKQISLACYLATGTAVHRSFALADNLGEVSAKAQIQTVCFDNLGLLLAASLNVLCRSNQRLQAGLPFVLYPVFSVIDICGIYQSLKHVHLQTLTKDRLETILNTWIERGYVPSPAEVSKLEGISLLVNVGKKNEDWPIRIGFLDPKSQIPLLTMLTMNYLSSEDLYFICMERCGGLRRSRQEGILLSLREGSGTMDIIMGLLQACYARKALRSSGSKWDKIVEVSDTSDSLATEWFRLIEDSKLNAHGDINTLHEQILKSSWVAKNILLGTQEQARYSFLGENYF